MLKNFHTIFKPAAEKFPGYIDVKLLKLRTGLHRRGPRGSQLSLSVDLRERRSPPEVDQVRRAPEGVAHGGEHLAHEELLHAIVRFEIRRSSRAGE